MSHLTAILGHDAIDALLWWCGGCCCEWALCGWRWCCCDVDDNDESCARLSVKSFWNIGRMATSSSSPSDNVFTRDMPTPPSVGGKPGAFVGDPPPVEPPDSRLRPWYTLGVLCMCGADGRLSPGPRFRVDDDDAPPPPPQDPLFSDTERCMELAVVSDDELSSSKEIKKQVFFFFFI